MDEFRKLTPRDLAFGIGRNTTSEEIKELLSKSDFSKGKPIEQALIDIKKRLNENRVKREL